MVSVWQVENFWVGWVGLGGLGWLGKYYGIRFRVRFGTLGFLKNFLEVRVWVGPTAINNITV